MANELLHAKEFAVESSQPRQLIFVGPGVESPLTGHLAAKIGILIQDVCLQEV